MWQFLSRMLSDSKPAADRSPGTIAPVLKASPSVKSGGCFHTYDHENASTRPILYALREPFGLQVKDA